MAKILRGVQNSSDSINHVLTVLVLICLSPVQWVMAQDANVLEEVFVTARKYQESLQDTPVSVNVMSSEYLEKQGISTVNDVIEFTPGATFVRFNKLQHEYSMRGIASQTEGASGDPSVITAIDNVTISKDFMKNPAFFDMERVEVLRGPQGTAFGRNASSGLVHLITKRPTREFEAGVTADFGTDGAYGVETYASGPLTDRLAGRVAFNFDTLDGYTEDTRTGAELGGEENIAVRGSLLFNPADNLALYVKAEYNKDDDETPVRRSRDCTLPVLVANPPGPPTVFTQFGPHPPWQIDYTDPCDVWKTTISEETSLGEFFSDREITNITAELTWEFSAGLTLTTVSGYVDGNSDYLQEAHGTPGNVLFQSVQNDASMFSQEIRIDNHASGNRLRWLTGFYYLNDEHDRDDQNILFFEAAPLLLGRPETRDIKTTSNDTESFGVFAEFTYDVTDRLNATLGARWSGDEKDYAATHTGFGWFPVISFLAVNNPDVSCRPPGGPPPNGICGTAANPVGFATPVTANEDWDDVSFRASLQYALSDEHMVYATVAQGYKTGGFQPEGATPQDVRLPYNEETVTTYEAGFKGDFAGRARLNVSVFYSEYDDLQILQFIPLDAGFVQRTSNAKGAEVLGVEIEAIWQVTDQLRLSGSYANQDSELSNGSFIDIDGDGVPEDLSNTRLDNVPDWTATAVAEYTFPFSDGSALIVRSDWRGRSDVFDDFGEQEGRLRPSSSVLGARVTWLSADALWSVSFWGKNLTEEEEVLNIGPPQPNTFQLPTAFGAPRTFGGTVSYRF